MSRIVQYQSSFTMGEFDPLVKGRVDITQYQSGLEKATNIVCIPQGAIERRPGQQVHRTMQRCLFIDKAYCKPI
jgi:hypothetical protein